MCPIPLQTAVASADWLAARFAMPQAQMRNITRQIDTMMEGALFALPVLEWYFAGALRRTGDVAATRKKTQ